jgi:hypothetical protein
MLVDEHADNLDQIIADASKEYRDVTNDGGLNEQGIHQRGVEIAKQAIRRLRNRTQT